MNYPGKHHHILEEKNPEAIWNLQVVISDLSGIM